MKLIIDIDEEDYNFVKKQVADGITNPLKMRIANGTPLPKGHGRLIDANKVDTAIYECFEGIQCYDGTGFDIYQEAKEYIDKIHSIIEADKAESEDKE